MAQGNPTLVEGNSWSIYVYEPAAAIDGAGNFVITWDRYSSSEVFARQYTAAGAARGAAFRVDAPNTRSRRSAVAMNAEGDYVVAWKSWSGYGIFAQRYANLAPTTAGLPLRFGDGVHRQPLLATAEIGQRGVTGDPPLPLLEPGVSTFVVRAVDVAEDATLLIDGAVAGGSLRCVDDACERIEIRLAARPAPAGIHLLQVQNPEGPQSNELPICISPLGQCF